MPDLPPLPPLGDRPSFAAEGHRFDGALRAARRRTGAALAGVSCIAALAVALTVVAPGDPVGLAPAGPAPSATEAPKPEPTGESSPIGYSPPPTTGPDGPLEVSIELLTPEPRAGEVVRYRVRVLRPYLGMHWYTVHFGDGKSEDGQGLVKDPACAGVHLDAVEAQDVDQVVEHAYRLSGTFDVTVTAGHVYSCRKPRLRATDRISVTVRPGDVPSNGPEQPYAYWPRMMGRAERVADGWEVQVTPPIGGDDDGWVSRAVMDWGDGTTTEYDFGLDGCNETPTAWPHGHRVYPTPVLHTYAQRGTYTVALTIVSTGCDGQDPQEVVDVRTFRV